MRKPLPTYLISEKTNFPGFLYHQNARSRSDNNMKKKIIAANMNEKIREKNEQLTDRKENNGDRNAGFLPIFFWTD
ncbi:MAG: hypothetical protein WA144_04430 [Candidatus Methanoperedens sp.]